MLGPGPCIETRQPPQSLDGVRATHRRVRRQQDNQQLAGSGGVLGSLTRSHAPQAHTCSGIDDGSTFAALPDTRIALPDTREHPADLGALPGNIVEVFCRCDPAVAAQRYARRAGTRAAGHLDAERTAGEIWNDEVARPVAEGWPVIEVDTTTPAEPGPLIVAIRAAAGAPSAGPPR